MIANSRNGVLKTLEISRDNANSSVTMLNDDFLKKPENFTLNIDKFIMNTSPPLNLIDEVMFTVFAQSAPNLMPNRLRDYAAFTPTPYYTWLELARQINNWATKLQQQYDTTIPGGHGEFLGFQMGATGNAQFVFKQWFRNGNLAMPVQDQDLGVPGYYIRVGAETQKVLGLPEYLFFVTDGNRVFTHADGEQYLFDLTQVDGFSVFVAGVIANNRIVEFPRQMNMFDQRYSLDVYSTLPTKSKISSIDGKEQHHFLLFQIPYVAQHSFESVTTLNRGDAATGYMISGDITLKENMDVGATDYCLNQSETIHQLLLPGVIRSINVFVRCRYLANGVFSETDIDFKNAFWYLKMSFSKKLT